MIMEVAQHFGFNPKSNFFANKAIDSNIFATKVQSLMRVICLCLASSLVFISLLCSCQFFHRTFSLKYY